MVWISIQDPRINFPPAANEMKPQMIQEKEKNTNNLNLTYFIAADNINITLLYKTDICCSTEVTAAFD